MILFYLYFSVSGINTSASSGLGAQFTPTGQPNVSLVPPPGAGQGARPKYSSSKVNTTAETISAATATVSAAQASTMSTEVFQSPRKQDTEGTGTNTI